MGKSAVASSLRGSPRLRTFATEGTVFWLVFVAVVEVSASVSASFAFEGFVVAGLNALLAYLCWTGRRLPFLGASVVALLTAVGAYTFPPQIRSVGTPFQAATDTLLVVGSLLVLLFGFRAYRELREPRAG
jgi:hypothetical protein